MKLLLVGIGGFLGANARYLLSGWITALLPSGFPFGTLIVNVSGSFVLSFFLALGASRLPVSEEYRLLVAVGFVGSYTTFSTLTHETLVLLEAGAAGRALLYAGGSLALGLLAGVLGLAAARAL